MGIEQRQHPRFDVHLAVRYATADEFVVDYVQNLSAGGLFVAGAHGLAPGTTTEVAIELPGRGSWRVAATVAFVLDAEAARATGRKPGAGLKIVGNPQGFYDALLGYLLKLGRRRDHAVIAGELPGVQAIADAGYRVVPLVEPAEVARRFADPSARVIAVVVAPSLLAIYRNVAGERAFAAATPDDIADVIERIDALLDG